MEYLATLWTMFIPYAPYLIGLILPPVVELLNKDIPNDNMRFIVSCALCVLAAILIDWKPLQAGSIDPQRFSFLALLIFGESQTIFKLYFQSSWLRQKIQTSINSVNGPQKG